MSRPQSPQNGPSDRRCAANSLGDLIEHADNRPTMATLPAHFSVASEAPIKDLRCCEDVVADEGSPDSELYPTPAPVANHVAETQRRKSNPCVRGVAPPLVEGCMGGHHGPARPPDADRAGRLGGVRARTDPRQDGRGQEAGARARCQVRPAAKAHPAPTQGSPTASCGGRDAGRYRPELCGRRHHDRAAAIVTV